MKVYVVERKTATYNMRVGDGVPEYHFEVEGVFADKEDAWAFVNRNKDNVTHYQVNDFDIQKKSKPVKLKIEGNWEDAIKTVMARKN